MDYEFHNSNGQLTYLGEWHTHPEPHPTPSFTDLNMLKDQFKHNKFHIKFLLMIIKGTAGIYIRLIDKDAYYECKI